MAEWFNELLGSCLMVIAVFFLAVRMLWRMAGGSPAGQMGQQAAKAAGKHLAGAMFRNLMSK